MELRTCNTTHFIQTIKGGLVQKVCNRTSNGRTFIKSKFLEDIYESEDAKRLRNPPSSLVFDHQLVNNESPCFRVADRTLQKVKHEIVDFSSDADDDFGSGSDDGTTLKQFKNRLLTKKRKRITIGENSQKEDENEIAIQDDSDLNELLINWKSKCSGASKAKRKRFKGPVISSLTIDIAIKPEENLVAECSPQIGGELPVVSRVKAEYPDAEQLGYLNEVSSGDDSSIGHNEVSILGQKRVLNEYNTEPPLCLTMSETSVTNQIHCDDLEDDIPMSILFSRDGSSVVFKTPESACREYVNLPSMEVEKQREIQDSHRESLSVEPNADLCNHSRSCSSAEDMPEEGHISCSQVPDMAIDGCVRFHQECNSEEKNAADFTNEPNADLCNHSRSCSSAEDMPEEGYISCSQAPDMAINGCVRFHQECNSEEKNAADFTNEPNADLCNHSRSCSSAEDMPEEGYISCSQVPDMAINGCVRFHQECNSQEKNAADFTNEPNDSQSGLDNTCGLNLVSLTPSKTIADEEESSTCSNLRNELNCLGHIEDELVKAVDKQDSALTIIESSLENMPCGRAEAILSMETHQPPERLLSSRKAFSPSSQEQLRLAMKSDEVCNDSNQNILECKEKLFENQSKKNSSPRSKIQNEVMVNNRHPGEVSQRKVPRRIIRKSSIAKGNLEGPRFSRTLPSVSSALSSVQGCSEGAIAFSQRQMQDMETLAEKLMKELKSMKEIVEQKLLFEAYRHASLKNDADEVKLAITNATKVEDMGKRWMSMIARDCTRFCKIMKLTPESTPASEDSSPREKRKIRFADEAGGQLCHIKYFDDDVAAPQADSDAAEQI